MERGIHVDITVADQDTTVADITEKNKIGFIREINVRNPTTSDARIQVREKYTIKETAYNRVKFDMDIVAGDSIALTEIKGKKFIGELVARSNVAGVQVYVGFEVE